MDFAGKIILNKNFDKKNIKFSKNLHKPHVNLGKTAKKKNKKK